MSSPRPASMSVPHPESGSRSGSTPRAHAGERGQTTAEYALVILAAAALATLLIAWAGRTDAVGHLFDAVLRHVMGPAT